MPRLINGVLNVPQYTSTGVNGEYILSSSTFTNMADDGSGAYAIQPGFLLYIQALNQGDASPIPGVAHRYKFTEVTVVDSATITGTILWDEGGDPEDMPADGLDAIISEASPTKRFGFPVSSDVYTNLSPGLSFAALNLDTERVTENISGGQSQKFSKNFQLADWTDGILKVVHSLASLEVNFKVLELVSGRFILTSTDVKVLDENTLEIQVEPSAIFMGKVVVTL
jgi:hypothetical protein